MYIRIFIFFRQKQIYGKLLTLNVETLQTNFTEHKQILLPRFLGASDLIIQIFFMSRNKG